MCYTGGNDADGDIKTMQCSVKECTTKQWHEESQFGENRGQFLTRKWREVLKMCPIIDKDREEFVDKTKEAEKTTTHELSATRTEKQQPLHKSTTTPPNNYNRNFKAMHANSFILGFGASTDCP